MTLSTVSPVQAKRKLMTAVMSCGITLHAALPPWIIVGAIVVVTKREEVGEPMRGRDGVRVARNILHERFERLRVI